MFAIARHITSSPSASHALVHAQAGGSGGIALLFGKLAIVARASDAASSARARWSLRSVSLYANKRSSSFRLSNPRKPRGKQES